MMGWVSTSNFEYKYIAWSVAALLIVGYQIYEFSTQPKGYDHIIYASTFLLIACAVFYVPFFKVKNLNIFVCPSCGKEIKK